MKKGKALHIFTILYCIFISVWIVFLLSSIYDIFGTFNLTLFLIQAVLLVPIVLIMFVITVISPYIKAAKLKGTDKFEFRKDIANKLLTYDLITKINSLPILFALLIALLFLTGVLILWNLWASILLVNLLPYFADLAKMVAIMFLVSFIYIYNFATSLYSINSVIHLMLNKQLNLLKGLVGIIILLTPIASFVFVILLKIDILRRKEIKIFKNAAISILIILVIAVAYIALAIQ